MTGGFSRSTDLHSPGAIGDVTPSTGAFTTTTLSGNFTFATDNTYDIGANGATRPRNIFMSGDLTCAGGATFTGSISVGSFGLQTSTLFSDGDIVVKSTFGAIKLKSASVSVRNYADNAYAPVQGKLTTDTNATTGLTAGVLAALTNATVTVYDASGQVYRVPCII